MLLLTKSLPTIQKWNDPLLGRLYTPRHYNSLAATVAAGIPWAADNDAFGAWDRGRYLDMVDALIDVPRCLFLTVPDVVGDAVASRTRWDRWYPDLEPLGFPLAYVLQDGEASPPWDDMAALFIGGTTLYKLSVEAAAFAREAKERGKWLHMGRVNTRRRFEYAASIGCDSIDGTNFVRWTDASLPWALKWLHSGQEAFS